MNKPLTEILDNFQYPESLHKVYFIKPNKIVNSMDLMARIKCMNCGLY